MCFTCNEYQYDIYILLIIKYIKIIECYVIKLINKY